MTGNAEADHTEWFCVGSSSLHVGRLLSLLDDGDVRPSMQARERRLYQALGVAPISGRCLNAFEGR